MLLDKFEITAITKRGSEVA